VKYVNKKELIMRNVIVLMFLGMIGFFTGCAEIKPTEVGVVIKKYEGRIVEQPISVGYHLYNPFATDIAVYDIAARSFPDTEKSEKSEKYTLDVKTKDGQNVDIDLTIIFSLRAGEVPQLHKQVGVSYSQQIIMPQIMAESRSVIGAYGAEDLYDGASRDTIQVTLKKRMESQFNKYPAVQLHDVLIRSFRFSPAFEKAIEDKKIASQQVEVNKQRALAQEEESKRQEAQARGEKLKYLQEAEAKMNAAKMEAQGQAEAIKLNADANRYKLIAEAEGKLAIYKSDAEGKKLAAQALGGGHNVVALKFAETLPANLKVIGVPMTDSSMNIMSMQGFTKGLFDGSEDKNK